MVSPRPRPNLLPLPSWRAAGFRLVCLGLLSLPLIGLAACSRGPSAEEQQRAEQRRQLQRRQEEQARAAWQQCQRDQASVANLVTSIRRDQQALAELEAQRYRASGRPQPPDPELAERFTQEDRELDELRYRERLRDWELAEQQRYGQWMAEQRARQQELRSQGEQHLNQLRRLNPRLFSPQQPRQLNQAAVTRYTQCPPQAFGLPEAKAVQSATTKTATTQTSTAQSSTATATTKTAAKPHATQPASTSRPTPTGAATAPAQP